MNTYNFWLVLTGCFVFISTSTLLITNNKIKTNKTNRKTMLLNFSSKMILVFSIIMFCMSLSSKINEPKVIEAGVFTVHNEELDLVTREYLTNLFGKEKDSSNVKYSYFVFEDGDNYSISEIDTGKIPFFEMKEEIDIMDENISAVLFRKESKIRHNDASYEHILVTKRNTFISN